MTSTNLWVCAPQYRSAGTWRSPNVSLSVRNFCSDWEPRKNAQRRLIWENRQTYHERSGGRRKSPSSWNQVCSELGLTIIAAVNHMEPKHTGPRGIIGINAKGTHRLPPSETTDIHGLQSGFRVYKECGLRVKTSRRLRNAFRLL